jgi:extradiol dioxygenase family protein
MDTSAFHYAFLVRDLDEARRFYTEMLECREGRSAETWIDFDFFGNQLSCHLGTPAHASGVGHVDGIDVPIPHFGVIVEFDDYARIATKLVAAGVAFVVSPRTRYAGEPGEHGTFFVLDPSGNPIEIKAFRRPDEVFAR